MKYHTLEQSRLETGKSLYGLPSKADIVHRDSNLAPGVIIGREIVINFSLSKPELRLLYPIKEN